jgi:hypothetical protein
MQSYSVPQRKPYSPPVSRFYDADRVAARHCGLLHAPRTIRGHWQHGWLPRYAQVHPLLLTTTTGPGHEHYPYLVSREDESAYLQAQGYTRVKPIGLPIVYANEPNGSRLSGSLLVMPAHSVPDSTHVWPFEAYAETIDSIRGNFSETCVCLNPVCMQRGYWVDSFRRRGIKVIQALQPGDVEGETALDRMRNLLSGFEYMTTNVLGSHIPYAAFSGCRVSIFGPYAETRVEDFANDPFYGNNPDVLEFAVATASEETVRHHYPELFCDPHEAPLRLEWGRKEIGYAHKITPAEMQSLFGWRLYQRWYDSFRGAVPSSVKAIVRPLVRRNKLKICGDAT